MDEGNREALGPRAGRLFKLWLVWSLVGAFAVAAVTILPATLILGLGQRDVGMLAYWSGMVIGVGGAIYGRYPSLR